MTSSLQVYGSKRKRELGTILQKCLLQGALLYLIVLGPYFNIAHIIGFLPIDNTSLDTSLTNVTSSEIAGTIGQKIGTMGETKDDDFRVIAISYMRMTAMLGYFDFTLSMISRYFAIQGRTSFVYTVALVMIGSHVTANYLLVTVADLGLPGLVLASYLSRLLSLATSISICFIMIMKGQFMWNGFSKQALKGWKPMFRLGLSGWINVVAELGMFEISTFCSQFGGTSVLLVVIIANKIQGVLWSVTNGICCASATLIGTALGKGDKREVKLNIFLSITNVLLVSIPLDIIEYCWRKNLVNLFSPEPSVVDLFVKTFWLRVIVLPIDHLQVVMNRGILTAFGKQRFIAVSMSIISYGVGLPIILATIFFTDMRVTGIFIGYASFFVVSLIAASLRISRLNLEEELDKTKARADGRQITKVLVTESEKHDLGVENLSFAADGEDAQDLGDYRSNYDTEVMISRDDESEIRKVYVISVFAALWCVTLSGLSLLSL